MTNPGRIYLRSRGLEVPDDPAEGVLRYDAKENMIVTEFRDIHTDAFRAVHRIYVTWDGRKIDRKMLGPVGGAAIKIDADEDITYGLVIGEGIETCLAARQMGLRPVWALGSAHAIAAFPVLPGIDALTILAERNADGTPNAASFNAVDVCGDRWRAAGREVITADPGRGDFNDVLLARQVAA